MSDDKTPLDQLLDLCVFGPIGLLVAARARYPELVEQGAKVRIGAIVEYDEARIDGVSAPRMADIDRMGVAARAIGGLEHGDVVIAGQAIGRDIACNSAAYHRDLHAVDPAVLPDSRRASGTGRRFRIRPRVSSSLRKYQVMSISHQ